MCVFSSCSAMTCKECQTVQDKAHDCCQYIQGMSIHTRHVNTCKAHDCCHFIQGMSIHTRHVNACKAHDCCQFIQRMSIHTRHVNTCKAHDCCQYIQGTTHNHSNAHTRHIVYSQQCTYKAQRIITATYIHAPTPDTISLALALMLLTCVSKMQE